MGVNYQIANHTKKTWINFSHLKEQNKICYGRIANFVAYLLQHIWYGDHVVLISDMDSFYDELIFENVYEDETLNIVNEYNRLHKRQIIKILKEKKS